jgi:hypothetical protein
MGKNEATSLDAWTWRGQPAAFWRILLLVEGVLFRYLGPGHE